MANTLADRLAELLVQYDIMEPLRVSGEGGVEGPATFSIVGRGIAPTQQILTFFLRVRVVARQFKHTLITNRIYHDRDNEQGTPELIQGYHIQGACLSPQETNALLGAFDLSEWAENAQGTVEEVHFWSVLPNGKVVPSGERHTPNTNSNSPDGNRGVYVVRASSYGGTGGGGVS